MLLPAPLGPRMAVTPPPERVRSMPSMRFLPARVTTMPRAAIGSTTPAAAASARISRLAAVTASDTGQADMASRGPVAGTSVPTAGGHGL